MPSSSTASTGPMLHSATRPKRHDERYGDRSGGHATRVKRHRNELVRHESRQDKHHRVKHNEQQRQTNFKQRTQHSQHEKQTDTDRDRPNQHIVRNGRHLTGQHLQIRLRDCDEHTDDERNEYHDEQIFRTRQLCADALAHRCHRYVRAE